MVDKEVLVIVDDYNHRMGFVDDNDLLAWAYQISGPSWREKKFTNALFYWALRKRADQALCAYMIKWRRTCRQLDALLNNPTASQEVRAQAKLDLKATLKKRPDHYKWLEDIAMWMVVDGYNKGLAPAKALVVTTSSAYQAIKAGPLKITGGQDCDRQEALHSVDC